MFATPLTVGCLMTSPSRLTRRQREIVALIAEGMTYSQIAVRLGIKRRTVRMHVELIARELPGSEWPLYRVIRHLGRLMAT